MNHLKEYTIITKSEFEAVLAELFSDFEEVEPAWTGSKWQGWRKECVYIGHLDGISGYVKVRSGINPHTELSNPCGKDAIHLMLRRKGQTLAHRQVNRLPRWNINLSKAVESFRQSFDFSNEPTDLTPSNAGCISSSAD